MMIEVVHQGAPTEALPKAVSGINLRQFEWNAVEELPKNLTFIQNKSQIAAFVGTVEPDMWAEYDARNLTQIINARFQLTELEQLVLAYWDRDERNHTEGLKSQLLRTPGVNAEELEDRLYNRQSDFTKFEPYLQDRFKFWMYFTYDELVTVSQYGDDRKLYNLVGGKELELWLARIQSDELNHYENGLTVLHTLFADRFAEVRGVINSLVEEDLSKAKNPNGNLYQNTFLGHRGNVVSPEKFYPRMGEVLLRRLRNQKSEG